MRRRTPQKRQEASPGTESAEPAREGSARLLLATGLTADEVQSLLRPYGFSDVQRADANLQAMAGEPRPRQTLARILPEILTAVSATADPDQALDHWELFLREGMNRVQLFEYLHGSPRMLHVLCTVFGNSPAMAQTFIRDPILVYWLAEEQVLTRRATKASLTHALADMLSNVTTTELKLEALRRFRRREMLRIGIRDLLKSSDVQDTILALSDLAAVLIQAAYEIVHADLKSRYGTPMHRNRRGGHVETGFAVIAMGKLGGGELNFSSDVDLIYVYESDEGETAGPGGRAGGAAGSITNEEYFEHVARDLTRALAESTQEGYVFRVDLRLRAEGAVGRLARSLDEYARYYRTRGQVWERMALLKAWPIAGSPSVGRAFLRAVKPFVFGEDRGSTKGADQGEILGQVRAIKHMIDEKMAGRGQERRNVKLGVGGIRELEFVVQVIQILSGGRLPALCHRGTLPSLLCFEQHGLLSKADHVALAQSYLFLRDVEHKLQMVHDLQTHALPSDEADLARCAVRLGYGRRGGTTAAQAFTADYRLHTARIHELFRVLVENPEDSRLLQAALHLGNGRKRGARRRTRGLKRGK